MRYNMTLFRALSLLTVLWLISGCNNRQPQVIQVKIPTASVQLQETSPAKTPVVIIKTIPCASPEICSTAPTPTKPIKQDLWSVLRAELQLKDSQHSRIQGHLDWYVNHPAYLTRVFKRAQPFIFWIMAELRANNIPLEIALLPIVESAYDPFAYSHGSAAGLWQFIPSTGRAYGLKQNWWYDGRRDIAASTQAAIRYLKQLNQQFNGDWLLALAAYNSGGGTVNKALRYNKRKGRKLDFWSLKLPRETRHYVPKLLALSLIINNPEKYGITLPPISNELAITIVNTQGQIDLALAAKLADMPLETLYKFNPGFNRWATDPSGPHQLILPIEKAAHFKQALADLDSNERVQWKRHKIKSGETLSHIAHRYQTTTQLLRSTNNLNNHQIRAGKHLLIPVAQKNLRAYNMSQSERHQRKMAQPKSRIKATHIVQAGDSLWDLSRKHKVSVRQLAAWNNMAPRDILRQGQKIIILKKAKNQTSKKTFTITPKATRLRTIRYTVRRGDSLARISQRFNVSTNDVCRWNNISKDQYLQPGQRLKILVDITKQAEG